MLVCPHSPVRGPVVSERELVRSVRHLVCASAVCHGGRAPPGVAGCQLGVGRCWSLRCGEPFPCVRHGASRCALSLCATDPGPSPSWPVRGFPPPCCAAPAALFQWAPSCYLGPLLAPLRDVLSRFLPCPCPCPFPSQCGGGGVEGGPAEHRWPMPEGGWSGATGGHFGGCRGGRGPGLRPGGGLPMQPPA